MRTLLSINDIMAESNKPELCQKCNLPVAILNIHVEFMTRQGKVFVHKQTECPEHGQLKLIRRLKSVQTEDDGTVCERSQ